MQFIIFCILSLFIYGCSSKHTITTINETDVRQKILLNQSEATKAQDEYKKLQTQRNKV